ncbi:dTDP-4-dehydrorhamnose reductase [Neisseria perflava]|uniref:dTDP-4-dehydrorhamnose reductase n=1 Tax=Neisseria perflava TaxID=33053 RepID=UPI00209F3C15|nr:dTDP-4-dehydrorhamnose reductase [Neisseria perflava]MCP1660261.1 dTDP-4-dehydrorhamnose reductase [Neisseria perflava]MCP1773328.1 dTDP-4-dehydrorhamnose reductase [Neisseria perflava]
MRILLTGSKGQLAHCFRDRLPDSWELIATDSASLDITNAAAVNNMVHSFQPDAIVNAAAYTAVDKAESEPAAAFAVNAAAVHNLAIAAHGAQARFIHVSTDYVFDGQAKTPYREYSPTNPQSIYGKSKLAGELLALAANPDSIIVRTSWLFSEYGSNFVKTMLRLAKERDSLSVVADQIGNPTYAGDLASALIALLRQSAAPRGIFHYCGNRSVSWYEFAQAVFQTASSRIDGFKAPNVSPIPSEAYPVPAPRPRYSVMDCRKIESETGVQASDWQKALNDIITTGLD